MPDQTHFLATPTEGDSVGRTLQLAAGNYVQYFNDTYRREGTIWEGRYRATVVESKRYLLTVMRYIESNVVCAPSRAKSAAKSVPKSSVAIRVAGPILGSIAPRDYLWSSHKRNAYGDAGPNSNWLVAADEYQQLGVDEPSRQRAYRDLFKRALAESDAALIGESAHKGWALGDAKFQTAIAELSGRRATRGARGRPRLPD